MDTAHTGTARRELAFVLFLASAGLTLVLLVAFAPWYSVVVSSSARPAGRPAQVAPADPNGLAEVDAALGR
jgi:hypothetical protein